MDDDDSAAHSTTAIDAGAIETTIGAVRPIRRNVVGTIVRGARAAAPTHHQSTRGSRESHAAETAVSGVRGAETVPTITSLSTSTAIPTSAAAGKIGQVSGRAGHIVFVRNNIGCSREGDAPATAETECIGSHSATECKLRRDVDCEDTPNGTVPRQRSEGGTESRGGVLRDANDLISLLTLPRSCTGSENS